MRGVCFEIISINYEHINLTILYLMLRWWVQSYVSERLMYVDPHLEKSVVNVTNGNQALSFPQV